MAPITTLADAALLRSLSDGVSPAGEQIAEALRRAVILRLFAEERLPSERELATLFGVSRITVRQAIHTLRQEGRVRSVGGRGGGTYQILSPASQRWRARGQTSWRELMDVVEFRSLIEPLAARLAATRVTKSLLRRLELSVDEMALSERLEEFRHADSVFHILIAEGAGNAHLLRATLVARADFLIWRDRLPIPFVPGDNTIQHIAILAALRSKDQAAAEGAMVAHLSATKSDLRREIGRLGLKASRTATHVRRAHPVQRKSS